MPRRPIGCASWWSTSVGERPSRPTSILVVSNHGAIVGGGELSLLDLLRVQLPIVVEIGDNDGHEFFAMGQRFLFVGEVIGQAKGGVLLHCTVAWRASHLWAAYLIEARHVDVEAALVNARGIALDDANPMMVDKGPQPVEEFLGRRLPTLGHPKK